MKFDLFLLSTKEKNIVKQNIKNIPIMRKSNPMCKMIGAKTGDVIKIIQDDVYSRMKHPSTYTSFVIVGK